MFAGFFFNFFKTVFAGYFAGGGQTMDSRSQKHHRPTVPFGGNPLCPILDAHFIERRVVGSSGRGHCARGLPSPPQGPSRHRMASTVLKWWRMLKTQACFAPFSVRFDGQLGQQGVNRWHSGCCEWHPPQTSHVPPNNQPVWNPPWSTTPHPLSCSRQPDGAQLHVSEYHPPFFVVCNS